MVNGKWLYIVYLVFNQLYKYCLWISGLIHTNGGSATSSGGGGGGFIAIYFDSGYVDDRFITSYGGKTMSGETGAAGVIYLQENGDRKVLVERIETKYKIALKSIFLCSR